MLHVFLGLGFLTVKDTRAFLSTKQPRFLLQKKTKLTVGDNVLILGGELYSQFRHLQCNAANNFSFTVYSERMPLIVCFEIVWFWQLRRQTNRQKPDNSPLTAAKTEALTQPLPSTPINSMLLAPFLKNL